jgi:uncharacterized protein (TIGR00251 family)
MAAERIVSPSRSDHRNGTSISDVDDLYSTEDDAVVLAVHVQPRAGRSAVLGRHGRALKLRVAAPPVDDRANAATVALLADEFGVPERDIELVAGERSRIKRFRLRHVDQDEFATRLRRTVDDADHGAGPRTRHRAD